MADGKDKLKEMLNKKTLLELEAMITEQKRKMSLEKDLTALSRLSLDLGIMQNIRDQKHRESSSLIHKSSKSTAKPELKSYDDYVKSKG